MRFACIQAEKANFPIRTMCRLLEVSRSGFHAWERRGPSKRALEDQQLALEVAGIFRESRGRYGGPRTHRELGRRGRRASSRQTTAGRINQVSTKQGQAQAEAMKRMRGKLCAMVRRFRASRTVPFLSGPLVCDFRFISESTLKRRMIPGAGRSDVVRLDA